MSLFPCCKQPQNTLLAVKDKKWGQGGVISEISRTISLKAALFNRTIFFPSLFLLLLFQEKKKGGGGRKQSNDPARSVYPFRF